MSDPDGAGDKLFHDESSSSIKDHVEVKFVSPDGNAKNGDAKINMDSLKSAFAGMGKDELMKFANDPFWVRLRWLLFFCFWLAWFGMLIGAIAIIVYAPKCALSDPKEFYEKSPLYEVDMKDYRSFKDMIANVEYFKKLGIQQLAISSVMKEGPRDLAGSELVIDFKDTNPAHGTMEEFKELVNKLKDKDIHVLLQFSPDYSSIDHEFFEKSVNKEDPYTNYYVWHSGKIEEGANKPPNNWRSKSNQSAWDWNEKRKEFYLHQFDKNQPDLNFNNPDVVKYFNDVFEFWMNLGVSGFYLENVENLLEDPEFKDDTIGEKPGHDHFEYAFYNHVHTAKVPGIARILNTWGKTIHNHTKGVLIVGDALTEPTDQVNLVLHKLEIEPGLTAPQLKIKVDKWVLQSKPTWQWSCFDGKLNCMSSKLLKILNIVGFLLPGTPITRTGEELGAKDVVIKEPWNLGLDAGMESYRTQLKSIYSPYSIYKQLVTYREYESIQYGDYKSTTFNSTVFLFTRIKKGSPGILVAVNLNQDRKVELNLSTCNLPNIPEKLTVLLTSESISSASVPNATVSSFAIDLPPSAGAVFSFAPKAAE